MGEGVSFSVTVPGKIILMGEHSVLYNKFGLAASINKRLFVNFEERESSDCVEIHFKELNLNMKWDFEVVSNIIKMNKPLLVENENFSIAKPELIEHKDFIDLLDKSLNLEEMNLNRSQKDAIFGFFYIVTGMLWCVEIQTLPFYLEITSEISIGAGTGSSAAFSIGVASALYNYIKLKSGKKFWNGNPNISNHEFEPYFIGLSEENNSFSLEDKEIINRWGYSVEKIMHGKPSGLDNTVCTYGNAVQINPKEPKEINTKLEHLHDLPTLRVLLVNSNIPRDTSGMIRKVADLWELCPEAVESVLASMDTVAIEFSKLLQELKAKDEGEDVREIYQQLSGLIDIQQGLLGTLGVSHMRLEEICLITKRRGLHSKLTGAGGGGYAFTLIPPHIDPSIVSQCVEDLKGSGFQVEHVDIFSEGLTLSI